MVRQILGEEQSGGLKAFHFIGETKGQTVIHIFGVRRVEAEPIDVILCDKKLAGVDEHVCTSIFSEQAVAPRRGTIEIEAALLGMVLLIGMSRMSCQSGLKPLSVWLKTSSI